jgi:hypothetical protein
LPVFQIEVKVKVRVLGDAVMAQRRLVVWGGSPK